MIIPISLGSYLLLSPNLSIFALSVRVAFIHVRKLHTAPWAKGDFDNAASAIMHDNAIAAAHLRNQRIWTIEPVRVLVTLVRQVGGHSFAAIFHIVCQFGRRSLRTCQI